MHLLEMSLQISSVPRPRRQWKYIWQSLTIPIRPNGTALHFAALRLSIHLCALGKQKIFFSLSCHLSKKFALAARGPQRATACWERVARRPSSARVVHA